MLKKILRYIGYFFLTIVALLFLGVLLAYLPPVQNFIKDKVTAYVTRTMDMNLSVEKFRMRFPLRITLDNTLITEPASGDTILSSSQITLDAALLPLLKKELKVRGVTVENASFNYRDSLGGIDMRIAAGELSVLPVFISLKNNDITAGTASLTSAKVYLDISESIKPDTAAAAQSFWTVGVSAIDLNTIDFRLRDSAGGYALTALLDEGSLSNGSIDLEKQSVSAERVILSRGVYNYLFDEKNTPQENDASDDASEPNDSLWEVTAGRIEIRDNGFAYEYARTQPLRGFDADHIVLTDIQIEIDSAYYSGQDIRGSIRRLQATDRSGLRIENSYGSIELDSTSLTVDTFHLQTRNSNIDITADVGIFSEDMPVMVDINGVIGSGDILLFANTPQIRSAVAGKSINIDGLLSGYLSRLNIEKLLISMPNNISLDVRGNLNNLTTPSLASGDLALNGRFRELDFVKGFIADTALRNRIGFPDDISLTGTLQFSPNAYAPDINIVADSGTMSVKGRIDLGSEQYDAVVALTNFPLHSFLPADSLGLATLDLTASGAGFDPRREGARADILLEADRLDYRNYFHRNIYLRAQLENGHLASHISSGSEALDFTMDIEGDILPDGYEAAISADIDMADLYVTGLSGSPLAFITRMQADGKIAMNSADTTYTAHVVIDSTILRYNENTERISLTDIYAHASDTMVSATVTSSDLHLMFNSHTTLKDFSQSLAATSAEFGRQIDSANIDMNIIQQVLPVFYLDLTAGTDNFLNEFLRSRDMYFRDLAVHAVNNDSDSLNARIDIDGFRYGSLTLDTLKIGARKKDKELEYLLRLANRPGNIDQMALIYIYGNMAGNAIRTNFYQRDRQDSTGFRFGLNTLLGPTSVTASIFPEDPIFGYEQWSINPDNYVTYNYNNSFAADLRLDADSQHVYITSDILADSTGTTLNLDMQGVDIGNTMRLFPSAIPLDGRLASDITATLDNGGLTVEGSLTVDSLTYDDRLAGNIGVAVDIESDSSTTYIHSATLEVDQREALTASGTIASGQPSVYDLQINIPSLPLYIANAFIPDDVVELSGELSGNLSVGGNLQNPDISGQLVFSDTQAEVIPIGTTFTLANTPLRFNESRMFFDSFTILSPRKSSLTLDGEADLSDFSNIYIDMDIYGSNFDLVNSERSGGSMVYGQLLADIDVTASGPVDALSIEGDVSLLNGSDVSYTLTSDDLDVDNKQQDFVTFVSFADTLFLDHADVYLPVKTAGTALQVNVDIDNGVEATLNLSEDGNNRIELHGEGSLTYSMNTQGDARFTGRYTLSGGRVVYNPPIINAANFSINDGSYVEWTGDIANPSFNITATETLRTTVTMEDNSSSTVNFNIIIIIANTLSNMSITFDLEAPDNIAIQNQLSSLAPEQRSSQAMSLLVYNTYTGPGTTAKVDTGNPLNSFIEKELNQWSRNNLQGVDLSFGINTVDDSSTGGSQHTDYSYKVSKSLFDDRVKVTIGGSLNTDATTEDNLKNNFVDDISLEYRLNKRDNMFLKAYRYNTQESILEGEVVETGFGFVVRRKLNRLTDLFKFSPSPERKQERSRRREIKRQIRNDKDIDQPKVETKDNDQDTVYNANSVEAQQNEQ